MSLADLLKYINTVGLLGSIIAVLYAGHRGVWVWKRDADERVKREKDEAERIEKQYREEIERIRSDAEEEAKRLQEERERERQGRVKYEDYTIRLLESARQAVTIATDAVARRDER